MSKHNSNLDLSNGDLATAEALSLLVINLNRFNAAFAENTRRLDVAIDKLNGQSGGGGAAAGAPLLPAEADVRRIAAAQIETLQKMQELMDYYMAEMGRTASVTDAALRTSLSSIKEAAADNMEQLNRMFVDQSEQFKRILTEERDCFEQFNGDILNRFNKQIEQLPQLAERLQELADVPARLDKLIERVSQWQTESMINANRSIRQALNDQKETAPAVNLKSGRSFLNTILLIISTLCLVVIALKLIL